MEHASLENNRVGKFWEYDCLMICTLLGLNLSNREIHDLCIKYNVLSKEDAEDPAMGFYALHHACHVEEGPVPRSLSRSFSLKYRSFRQALEKQREDTPLDLENLLAKTHPKPLGGSLWAALNDPRRSVQAQGIYGAHKIVLEALREYQKKLVNENAHEDASESSFSGKTLGESPFSSLQRELGTLRGRCEDLEKKLLLRDEEERRREESFREEKKKLMESYETKISSLRRHIRLLEYSPGEAVSATPRKSCPFGEAPREASQECSFRERSEPSTPTEATTECPSHECPFCLLSNTTISVIGGLSRLEQQYREVVERMGARCRYHCGNCQQGGKALKQIIQSSDRVVFITSINSHNALRVAKGICKKEGKPLHLLREASPAALEKIFTSTTSKAPESTAI